MLGLGLHSKMLSSLMRIVRFPGACVCYNRTNRDNLDRVPRYPMFVIVTEIKKALLKRGGNGRCVEYRKT